MSDNLFSDGSASSYAELPVKVAYLRWRRGNANMRAVMKSDPAIFFGGWKANTKNRDGELNPELPLPVVERVSEDGKHTYEAYASNVIEFLPVQHRTRFELREKTKDPQTGKEMVTIRAVSKDRIKGYTPVRQVFGLVFVGDKSAPAVLYIDNWSSFISFERAGQKWGKVQVPQGMALIRRYGSTGTTEKDTGATLPTFETYGEARTTPIEAIDTAHPRFIKITPELMQLVNDSAPWRNCPRWNAEGEANETIGEPPALKKFIDRCNELGLSNVDIEQLAKEYKGDYAAALKAINEESDQLSEVDLNAQLEEAEQF